MRIFFSHSSSDKSLVREIKSKMYDFLEIWMDEKELLVGENLEQNLKSAVTNADLLVVFLSKKSIHSDWVIKELKWAISKEKSLNRPFLIPVKLENDFDVPKDLKDKLYLKLNSQEESEIDYFSARMNKYIFQLVIKYGLSNNNESEESAKESSSKENVISSYGGFIKHEVESVKEKYLDFISSNSELSQKTLFLLLKEELITEISEGENKEKEWSKQLDDGESEEMKMFGVLGSTMFDIRVKISKKILEKVKFIEKNLDAISPNEGLYFLGKYITKLD